MYTQKLTCSPSSYKYWYTELAHQLHLAGVWGLDPGIIRRQWWRGLDPFVILLDPPEAPPARLSPCQQPEVKCPGCGRLQDPAGCVQPAERLGQKTPAPPREKTGGQACLGSAATGTLAGSAQLLQAPSGLLVILSWHSSLCISPRRPC